MPRTASKVGFPSPSIVNYVQLQSRDLLTLSFDALDFIEHAKSNYALPGDTVLSVAVGTEIWNGPLTGLAITGFSLAPE